MNFSIEKNTIALCLTGSRLYGTANPDSDWDYKGIAIAPLDYYLGIANTFEQYEGKIDPSWWFSKDNDLWAQLTKEKHDCTIYDIRKYCHLASLANPNILEILFSEMKYCIYGVYPWWEDLQNIKEAFLSKKCRYTYAGYAHAQLKRIRTHRQWLLKPPTHKPTRKEFDLPEVPLIDHNQLKTATSLVDKQIEQWCMHPEEEIPITVLTKARESIIEMIGYILSNYEIDTNPEHSIIMAAGKKLGFDDNFLQVLAKEKGYKSANNQWNQYLEWQKSRNAKRSELETKYGMDTKHASHLVRLMRTCEELMTTGKLIVTRPDAEELKAIRNGAWTYDQLEEFAKSMDKKMDTLYNSAECPLPHKPDLELINKTCTKIIKEFHDLARTT